MNPPYSPLFKRLLVADDSPSKGTNLAPYFFDFFALAFILGTEEALRAGASWHLWASEMAAGLLCGVIGLRWARFTSFVTKCNPWGQLKQARTRISELEELLLQPMQAAIAIPLRIIHTIDFGYIPISPLEKGWKQEYNDDGVAEFGSDPDIHGSLRMRIVQSEVAIHHNLPPHAILADHLEFTAKYTNAKNPSMIFTRLIVGTKDGSAQRNVDIKFYYGGLRVIPTSPNPNPGRDSAKWLPEQTIYFPAQVRAGGQLTFGIDLRDAVSLCLGGQGWIFKSIQGVRLRGNLSISPIVLSST
jgi:hypothetical protein